VNRLFNLWIESPVSVLLGRVQVAHIVRGALFIAVFLLGWVSLQPFADLGDANAVDAAVGRGLTYASFGTLAVLSLVLVAQKHAEALRSFASAPYILFGAWICINLVLSRDPTGSATRFTLTAFVLMALATALLLPASVRELNRWLGIAVLSFLAICYLGIVLVPHLSIHMSTDIAEWQLAGDWRGTFDHKNTASAVMAMLVFIGIYLTRSGAVLAGPLITALAVVFLFFARGKTAIGLCVLIFILVELVVAAKTFRVRAALCFTPLIVMNLLSVGTIISPTLAEISRYLPFDTTFTGRNEVWKFAVASIAQRPIFGYGYFAFWGSDFVRNADPGEAIDDWVVIASHSHNGYLDTALTLGIPGLVLLIAVLVVVPLKNYHEADMRGQATPLARMFLRIWLFGVLLASLESFFLDRTDPIWFTFLIGVIGLHYVARFRTTS
jgi:O-antigen ligase